MTTTHTVQAGQTLSGIVRAQLAQKLNVSESQVAPADVKRGVDEVARLNGIADPNRIRAGQTITLPDSFSMSSGPAPQLGAGGGVAGAGSLFAQRLNQAAGTIKGAERNADGHLVVKTAAGAIDVGHLDGGGSIGQSWTTLDKSAVLFSKNTGGGYENENQSLFLVDGKSGQVRPLLTGDVDNVAIFDDITFTKGSDGTPLALASESDSGLGRGTTHVIDLAQGRVLASVDGSLSSLEATGGKQTLHLTRMSDAGDESKATLSLQDALKAARPTISDAKIVEGELRVKVGGETVNLGHLDGGGSRGAFWTTPDAGTVIFAKNTGGGFENEDQTLYAFDASTKKTRVLIGDGENPAMFDSVSFVANPSGGLIALASEADGGLGKGTTHAVDVGTGRYLGSVDGSLAGVEAKGFDVKLKLDVMHEDIGETKPAQSSLSALVEGFEANRTKRASDALDTIVTRADHWSDEPSTTSKASFAEIEGWVTRYFGAPDRMWRISDEDRTAASKMLDAVAPKLAPEVQKQVTHLAGQLRGDE